MEGIFEGYIGACVDINDRKIYETKLKEEAVSYTHLRAHETVLDLVCRLLLEKKKYNTLLIVDEN